MRLPKTTGSAASIIVAHLGRSRCQVFGQGCKATGRTDTGRFLPRVRTKQPRPGLRDTPGTAPRERFVLLRLCGRSLRGHSCGFDTSMLVSCSFGEGAMTEG